MRQLSRSLYWIWTAEATRLCVAAGFAASTAADLRSQGRGISDVVQFHEVDLELGDGPGQDWDDEPGVGREEVPAHGGDRRRPDGDAVFAVQQEGEPAGFP